jgi:hypothetical protein
MIRSDTQIDRDLMQWGEYSRRYCDGLGFPSMTGFRREAGAPLDWEYDINHVPVPYDITEDYALLLDGIIANLINRKGGLECRTALDGFYKYRMTKKKLSESMRITVRQLDKVLENAKLYISIKLESYPQK